MSPTEQVVIGKFNEIAKHTNQIIRKNRVLAGYSTKRFKDDESCFQDSYQATLNALNHSGGRWPKGKIRLVSGPSSIPKYNKRDYEE